NLDLAATKRIPADPRSQVPDPETFGQASRPVRGGALNTGPHCDQRDWPAATQVMGLRASGGLRLEQLSHARHRDVDAAGEGKFEALADGEARRKIQGLPRQSRDELERLE